MKAQQTTTYTAPIRPTLRLLPPVAHRSPSQYKPAPGVPFPLLTTSLIAQRYDLNPNHPAVRLFANLAQRAQREGHFTTVIDAWSWLHKHPIRLKVLPLPYDCPLSCSTY